MLTELLLYPFFAFAQFLVSLFPSIDLVVVASDNTLQILSFAISFFPLDLWVVLVTNISGWLAISVGWSAIEWVYKKIPGVD